MKTTDTTVTVGQNYIHKIKTKKCNSDLRVYRKQHDIVTTKIFNKVVLALKNPDV